MTKNNPSIPPELREKLINFWYAAYNDGMRVARGGGDDGNQLKAVDAIADLITAHTAEAVREAEQQTEFRIAHKILIHDYTFMADPLAALTKETEQPEVDTK